MEFNHYLIGTIHFINRNTSIGLNIPMVFGRAIQGDTIDNCFIDTYDILTFDGYTVLNNGNFLTEHGGAGIVAT